MRICFTLLAAFITFGFYSCTTCSVKKVPCGAFDEPAFFKWFPYRENDVLLFKNTTTADTFSYVVYRSDASGAYEASRGGYNNTTHGCNSSASVTTWGNATTNTSFNVDYNITKEFDNGPVNKFLFIGFHNSYWYAGEINETKINASAGNASDSITITAAENVSFDNGITYPYVVTLLKDTAANKTDKVYKLLIAKNSGIIGFEMFPSKQKWIIQ